jgi:hypothetical protein
MIVLTEEMIESLRTPRGGFNRATTDALGISWPLVSGWKKSLIGTSISDRRWREALKARTHERHIFRGNTRKSR